MNVEIPVRPGDDGNPLSNSLRSNLNQQANNNLNPETFWRHHQS